MTTKKYIEKAQRSKVWYGWHILETGMMVRNGDSSSEYRKVRIGETIRCYYRGIVACCANGVHGCFEVHEAWSWRAHGQCLTFCRFEADSDRDKDFDTFKFAARKRTVLWASKRYLVSYIMTIIGEPMHHDVNMIRQPMYKNPSVQKQRRALRNAVIKQMKADGFPTHKYAFFKAQQR